MVYDFTVWSFYYFRKYISFLDLIYNSLFYNLYPKKEYPTKLMFKIKSHNRYRSQ
jgi:hypothetical protein